MWGKTFFLSFGKQNPWTHANKTSQANKVVLKQSLYNTLDFQDITNHTISMNSNFLIIAGTRDKNLTNEQIYFSTRSTETWQCRQDTLPWYFNTVLL